MGVILSLGHCKKGLDAGRNEKLFALYDNHEADQHSHELDLCFGCFIVCEPRCSFKLRIGNSAPATEIWNQIMASRVIGQKKYLLLLFLLHFLGGGKNITLHVQGKISPT